MQDKNKNVSTHVALKITNW